MASPASTLRVVHRHPGGGPAARREEALAVEEPLEIRVGGETVAITMRTPGDDRALAVGFLFAEGVIQEREQIGRVLCCVEAAAPGRDPANVVDVVPSRPDTLPVDALLKSRRGTLTTAACGVCGRRSIADLEARLAPIRSAARLPASVLCEVPKILARHQPLFERTGAVHAAALLDADRVVLAAAEDVGRHNAVDRVVGALFLDGRLPSEDAMVLAVSGRVSFEIVQKAAAAGVPFVVAVSAATSLAVDLADRVGLTLCAFARAGRLTVYTHPERVT